MIKLILLLFLFSNATYAYVDYESEKLELLNHQTTSIFEGTALEIAQKDCQRDQRLCRTFDRCVARTYKHIVTYKNTDTGERTQKIHFSISALLTTKEEEQSNFVAGAEFLPEELPLKNHYSKRVEGNDRGYHLANYADGILNTENKYLDCATNDGCPIPLYRTTRGTFEVNSNLMHVKSFELESTYTLHLERTATLSCRFE